MEAASADARGERYLLFIRVGAIATVRAHWTEVPSFELFLRYSRFSS